MYLSKTMQKQNKHKTNTIQKQENGTSTTKHKHTCNKAKPRQNQGTRKETRATKRERWINNPAHRRKNKNPNMVERREKQGVV